MSQDIVTFGVIGLGYVGLPLSVEAGRSGLKVFQLPEGFSDTRISGVKLAVVGALITVGVER